MRELLRDDDGENRAVRTFLMQWGLPGLTVGAMRNHMSRSGWDGCWPAWVEKLPAGSHLTKGGAQDWLRYLFSLEGGNTSENTAVHKGAKNGPKTAETRMGSGFDGDAQVTAPAAGTEKDAEPMVAAGQKMAAWLHGLSKSGLPCRSWSRTCAELAQQWDCVAAAHTKAREGA